MHALALHHRVVMFDNSGVGRTQELPQPFSVDAMADQTSALITALGLGRPDVLGWSMGGMIAQALAVLHPAQVRRLVLCATYPGSGQAVIPAVADRLAASDFPANQASALNAFKAAVAEYPPAPAASSGTKGIQDLAVSDWQTGSDAAGRQTARISAPTLIADGTSDQLDPVANDRTLARIIPGATLVLTPTPGTRSCSRTGLLRRPGQFVPGRKPKPIAAGAAGPGDGTGHLHRVRRRSGRDGRVGASRSSRRDGRQGEMANDTETCG